MELQELRNIILQLAEARRAGMEWDTSDEARLVELLQFRDNIDLPEDDSELSLALLTLAMAVIDILEIKVLRG